MEKLTIQNELRLLEKAFRSNDFIGTGSSRAVYGLDEKTVLKVVADLGGLTQNKLEAETYEQHTSSYLAKVYAIGRYVLVMERVRLDEMDDNDLENYYDVQDYLAKITGDHGDNYQIARAMDGRTVAYDYGFNTLTDRERSNMVGNVRGAIRQCGSPLKLLQVVKKKVIKTMFK